MRKKFWFIYTVSISACLLLFIGGIAYWKYIRPVRVREACANAAQRAADHATAETSDNINQVLKTVPVAAANPSLVNAYNTALAKYNQEWNTYCTVRPMCNTVFYPDELKVSYPLKNYVDSQQDIDDTSHTQLKNSAGAIDKDRQEADTFCISVNGIN